MSDQLTYRWLITLVTIAYMIYSMRGVLLATSKRGNLYTEYAIISTLVWLTTTRLLLVTFGETGFSTAFSLSLGVAAFILMCIGMRYHSKEIRIVSLCEFAIIIGKLVLNDVWAMPSLGKILSSSALEPFSLSSHSSIKSLKMLSLMRMNKNRSKPQH